MADTQFGVNDSLTVKAWSRKLRYEALKETWCAKFIGEDKNSVIVKENDLQKGPGDRIRIGLRMQLTGAGVQGGVATQEGNEESLTTYSDDLLINSLSHAVRFDSTMSAQRVAFDLRMEAMDGLKDWWADRLDTAFFNQLCGNTGQTDTKYTGNNATVAPDSLHLITSGPNLDTTEASLSATTTFSFMFRDLDRAKAIAKAGAVPIRPIKIRGGEYYVAFIHPYSVYQLRRDTSTNNFMDIARQALAGNVAAGKEAIYEGALGIYNGVILHEATRIPIITGTPASGAAANFRRNIFAGAQAASIAFGKANSGPTPDWVEEEFDYKRKVGVAGSMVHGIKKMVFNGADFGTIAISSYAPTV